MSELRDPAEALGEELGWQAALECTDLLGTPVAAALKALEASSPHGAKLARRAQVVQIDPQYSDTDALNEHYCLDPAATGNCVLVAGKRTGEQRIGRRTARRSSSARACATPSCSFPGRCWPPCRRRRSSRAWG